MSFLQIIAFLCAAISALVGFILGWTCYGLTISAVDKINQSPLEQIQARVVSGLICAAVAGGGVLFVFSEVFPATS